MLHGHLDTLISAGIFEGWAYDDANPLEPLCVAVLDDKGVEAAHGLAHLYREDLVTANCGVGWCAFRLRTDHSVSQLRTSSLQLVERHAGSVIAETNHVNYIEDSDIPLDTIADVLRADPTCLFSIEQLSGCHSLFDDFIRGRGVDAFIRSAYAYVLGRAADVGGLALYGNLLRKGMIAPNAVIQTLVNSAEFQTHPRSLLAPNMVGFPFRVG